MFRKESTKRVEFEKESITIVLGKEKFNIFITEE